MSSLLQFTGHINRRGVGLQFEELDRISKKVVIGFESGTLDTWTSDRWDYPDKVWCPICGQRHARIHVAYRKPAGMFGCWVVFRINGSEEVPDLSIPISVGPGESIKHLPKGAVPLTGMDNARAWHPDGQALKDYKETWGSA